jgi:hypothetical protein
MEIEWLPEIVCLDSCGGNWDNYCNVIYKIFHQDFVVSRPKYNDIPVAIDTRLENGKEATFWHIIQTDNLIVGERLPDFRRCERVCWIRPIIENAIVSDGGVLIWTDEKKGQIRTYLWLKEMNYLVVLRVTMKYAVLITAFYVDSEHMRNKLLKDFHRTQKPPGLNT